MEDMTLRKYIRSLEIAKNMGCFFVSFINMAKNSDNIDRFETRIFMSASKNISRKHWEVKYKVADMANMITIVVYENKVSISGPQTLFSTSRYWSRRLSKTINRIHGMKTNNGPQVDIDINNKTNLVQEFVEKYKANISNNRITELSYNRFPYSVIITAPEYGTVDFLIGISSQFVGDFMYARKNDQHHHIVYFEKNEDFTLAKLSLDRLNRN